MQVHVEFNSRLFGIILKSASFKAPQFKPTTISCSLCIVGIIFLLKLQICFQNTVTNLQFSANRRMAKKP